MYPTPSASCQMDVVAPPETVTQNKSGWTVTRLKEQSLSETERCDQQIRSRGNVSNTNSTGLRDNTKQEFQTNMESGFATHKDDERTRTWWETESKLRGVPHGISYELDKDRANRIKALGIHSATDCLSII